MNDNEQYLCFIVVLLVSNRVFGIKQLKENIVNEFKFKQNQCVNESNETLTCNYIPRSLPEGISRVIIADFLTTDTVLEVKASDFDPSSWGYVTHLTMTDNLDVEEIKLGFNASSFSNLKSLKKLELHILTNFHLDSNAFLGLDNVTTLDVSYSARLEWKQLLSTVNGTDKLPMLETAIFSQIYYKEGSLVIGPEISALADKTKLKVVEFTGTQFAMLRPYELSKLISLKVINMSYSHFADISTHLPSVDYMKTIRIMDIGYTVLPNLDVHIPPEILNKTFVLFPLQLVSFVFAPKIVNVSGVIFSHTPIVIKNCTATCILDLDVHVEEIFAKLNNFRYVDLDVDVVCKNFAIRSITRKDISQNGLQFVHPSISLLTPNIKYLNLSMNELSVMASENLQLFENSFKNLPNLEEIGLSGNGLNNIPWSLFKENKNLVLIDLSYNRLTQITFDLSRAEMLQSLLLHNNQIQIIDSASINNLMNIPEMSSPERNQTNLTVTIYGNPLSCAQCQTKQYLQWLLSTDLVDFRHQHLVCFSENGITLDINNFILNTVEAICRRELTIVSSCVSSIVVLFVLLISFYRIYKRKINADKLENFNKALRLLKQGHNQYEYAVFLSYSSSDDTFVQLSVVKQLEEALKETSGIDRPLVCQGDLNLRPGHHVMDETIRCIERSSVVVVIASINFCQSAFCHNEIYQAYNLKKPIILFFKEKVDENVMPPVMKLIFKRNVRVLFEENTDGDFILKNTWENVCKSIIGLIADQM